MDDALNTDAAPVEPLVALGAAIAAALPGAVTRTYVEYGELNVVADAPRVLDVLTHLRGDAACQFICFIDITATDYPARAKRFDVVYHLLSPRLNQRVRIKAAVGEGETIPRPARSSPPPIGSSARPMTCSACSSPAIRTCGASSRTMVSRGIRCARISR